MFNQCWQSNKTGKGLGVQKNDTSPLSLWDIPLALVLLTRLPVPTLPQHVFKRQSKAAWAFPIAGAIVGGLGLLVGQIAVGVGLPPLACAGLIVSTLIVTTGAMHEDGLADTFDGFWGGFVKERRLEIMKDSHIGTYGVLALLLSQLIRVAAIVALLNAELAAGVLAACIFSRALMPVPMALMANARSSGLSHSVGEPPRLAVVSGLGLAFLLAILLVGATAVLSCLLSLLAVSGLWLLAKAKIGGQTGDVLGATQQIGEITFLLALTASL